MDPRQSRKHRLKTTSLTQSSCSSPYNYYHNISEDGKIFILADFLFKFLHSSPPKMGLVSWIKMAHRNKHLQHSVLKYLHESWSPIRAGVLPLTSISGFQCWQEEKLLCLLGGGTGYEWVSVGAHIAVTKLWLSEAVNPSSIYSFLAATTRAQVSLMWKAGFCLHWRTCP